MTRSPQERIKGKWRITEVEGSSSPDINLDEPAHIEFLEDGIGGFCMAGLDADVDFIAFEKDRELQIEFTWAGIHDECGRGTAYITGKNKMAGEIWIHMGPHILFYATRWGRWAL